MTPKARFRPVASHLSQPNVSIEPSVSEAAPSDPVARPERRALPRVKRLLAAKIVYNSGTSLNECTLRDLTVAGARLQVSADIPLPETFQVVQLKDRTVASGRLIWRHKTEVGVNWVGEPVNLVDSSEPGHRRLARQLGLAATLKSDPFFEITSLD